MPRRRIQVEWPCWYHSPDGETKMFNSIQEVPSGWTRKPQQQYVAPEPKALLDFDEIIQQLKELGVHIDPRWGRAKLKEVLDDHCTSR